MKIYLPLDRAVGRYADNEGRCCAMGAQDYRWRPLTPDDDQVCDRVMELDGACRSVFDYGAITINDGKEIAAYLTIEERTMALQLAILAAGHTPVIVER